MASRASSVSEGEVADTQLKANTLSQPHPAAIDGSGSAFGLDGASDHYGSGRPYHPRSRSPSPYRRKPDRSRSPYRRMPDRSPSPYRRKPTRSPSPFRRTHDRSPSPYRHGRGNRGGHSHDSRSSHNKRKGSPPPRPGRPDKRYYADKGRHDDRRPKTHNDDARGGPRSQKTRTDTGNRPYPSPISYADNEQAIPVPGFRDAQHGRNNGRQQTDKGPKSWSHTQGGDVKQSATPAVRSGQSNDIKMTDADDEPDYTLTLAVEDIAPSEESREEKKRKWAAKRAEIAARQAAGASNDIHLRQQAIINNATESTTPNVASPAGQVEPMNSPPADSPRYVESGPASPDVMIIDKQDGAIEGDSPSAANYDPTEDMLEDRARAVRKAQQTEVSSTDVNETDPGLEPTIPHKEQSAPANTGKRDYDMFASDDEENGEEEDENETPKGTVLDAKLLDNWDDADGYYKIIHNELVNAGKYRMLGVLGRGVFANVAKAEDVKDQSGEKKGKLVAIKIVRKIDMMRQASQKEMDFVRRLNEADPPDKRNIIRLLGSFDHKGHLCIVFEHMAKNLRDLLKEDTNGHGLSLQAVKMYSRQMFNGLQHLRDNQIIHLDLKPDNILVSHDKKSVKLCDLGTAADKRDIIDHTQYLVSRFYRAPEIVLDMEYGYAIDMWAIGCTMYELWTGKILFTGRSNNQMIKAFLECLGWPSEKLLRKGHPLCVSVHFESGPPLKFISREVDQQGNLSVRKIEQQKKISRDLKSRVLDAARGITEGGPSTAELADFADLLGATLNWNVEKRIQPKEALAHKLFATKPLIPRAAVIKPSLVKRGGSAYKR